MAMEDYVPVAADDWYQRRRQDSEGEFFRRVASQGPRKGEGGSTRQGIYALTAKGKLLAYKNAGQNPEVMRETLRRGLEEWRKLPDADRAAGKIGKPDRVDPAYDRAPPRDGLILKVYARALERESSAKFSDAVCKVGGGDEASRDHMWLTEAEWRSLLPAELKSGERLPLPAGIAERMLRFHLVDNTRGEPPLWRRDEIRSRELELTVESVTPAEVRLRLEGAALLATDADPEKARRGYDAALLGHLVYDRRSGQFKRFDVLAIGDHWGNGPFTRGARPGRAPLGIAFELVDGSSPLDRIPPQGAREWGNYFGR